MWNLVERANFLEAKSKFADLFVLFFCSIAVQCNPMAQLHCCNSMAAF